MSSEDHWRDSQHEGIRYLEALHLIEHKLISSKVNFGHGTQYAAIEANWLIASACGLLPDSVTADMDFWIQPKAWKRIVSILECRVQTRQPMAYLLGEAWFAGHRFSVDKRVVVPRSYFAEWLPVRFEPMIKPDNVRSILDLCCGSGCIGIVAALEFPEAEVMLSDLSKDALEVATENSQQHGVSHRVTLNHGNGFEGIDRCFDLILCNPPYVSPSRMKSLPPEYQAEPKMGLESGEDGLECITHILDHARHYLTPGGALIVEAGSAGEAVLERWPSVPFTWLWTECGEPVLFMLQAKELARYGF